MGFIKCLSNNTIDDIKMFGLKENSDELDVIYENLINNVYTCEEIEKNDNYILTTGL